MRGIYFAGTAGLAFVLVQAPAFAQTGAGGPTVPTNAQQSATPSLAAAPDAQTAGTASAADSEGITDIVVTAQRRTSTSQRTPATLEVLGGTDLRERGVGSINDALANVSGVFVQSNNKGVNINIRGVGTGLDAAAGDPGVNTNIDGVYIRQASAVTGGLYDIDRIEVLKGPQGTLYGRNATGGVANIVSADPTQDLSFRGSITGGNYDLIRTDAALNLPLSDTLAARAAFGSESHDGYYDTGQDDAKRYGGRLKLLWKPSDAVRILAGASYGHDGGNGVGSILVSEPRGSRHAPAAGNDAHLDQDFTTLFSTIEVDTGPVVVTFIPTYSSYVYNSHGFSAGFLNEQRVREHQYTSELRFSSPSASPIQWVAGLYYYNDDLSNYALLINENIINDQPNLKTKSYAAFADTTIPLSDSLRLIGGIRYTKDKKTQRDTLVVSGPTTVGPFDGDLNSEAVNFRVGAQYDLTPSAMLYATYATGYKAGGFVPDQPGFNTFKPERLRSIEGGLKSRLFDNRLQLNLGGFYYSYDNYQVSTLGIAHYGGISALVYNSQGNTKLYGAELQLNYRPTTNDELGLSVSPLHSKYGRFQIPATTIMTPGGPIVLAPAIDITGKTPPSSPGLSGSASYQHDWRFTNGRVSARVETAFSSSYYSEFSHSPFSHQPGYTRTDLNLTYFGKDDAWSIGGFVRNVENRWIVSLKANTMLGDYFLQPPRTYGLTLTLRR